MAEQPPPGESPAQPPQQPSEPTAPPAPAEAAAPPPAEASAQPAATEAPAQPAAEEAPVTKESIDALLKQANPEDAATVAPETPGNDAEAFKLPSFQQVMADAQVSSIDLLRDVELNVKIELGRSRMLVDEVLKLSEGSVVELDKLAGDPVDVFVNDRLVARGEVLVLNDNFCVRVNEIVPGAKEEAT
ncbi:MAG: flagellar motor switch protein FliN [Tepidisphaeraceae bacterium]|jgi:flagellar motor switch protein FliN/FliY